MQKKTIFYRKNFLIYGFGKSGLASFNFLREENNCKIIDDIKTNIPKKLKNKAISYKKLKKNNFDYIVLSPGIDLNKFPKEYRNRLDNRLLSANQKFKNCLKKKNHRVSLSNKGFLFADEIIVDLIF